MRPQPAMTNPLPQANVSNNDLLNSFFTDLSKTPINVPPVRRQGGANFFNQTFNNQMANRIAMEAQ